MHFVRSWVSPNMSWSIALTVYGMYSLVCYICTLFSHFMSMKYYLYCIIIPLSGTTVDLEQEIERFACRIQHLNSQINKLAGITHLFFSLSYLSYFTWEEYATNNSSLILDSSKGWQKLQAKLSKLHDSLHSSIVRYCRGISIN